MRHLSYHYNLPFSAQDVFDWHKRPGAFERLCPPWLNIRLVDKKGEGIQNGVQVTVEGKIGPFKSRQTVEHCDYIEGKQFKDVQIQGPYTVWEHTHGVQSNGPETCTVKDEIKYEFRPALFLSSWLDQYIEKNLNLFIAYRHRTLKHDLSFHQGVKSMKILVTGSSGLVGSALVPFLTTGGHHVMKLVRARSELKSNEMAWDVERGRLDPSELEGFDAVIHLAGENIGNGRWTNEKKRKILDSRVLGTRLLCQTLASLKAPPKVLISASAIGYYGNRGDEILTEHSPKGEGFLADVCGKWEEATRPAADKGIRVVNLRTGMVLSPKGGGLKQMLPIFEWGMGGKFGSGNQYMSWIAIDDLLGIIAFALQNESLRGPVNAVSPHPVTNEEFTKALGHVLYRPTFMSMPSFMAKLVFGEMADELLMSSQRVIPKVLEESAFKFAYSDLEKALRHLLGKMT